MFPSSSFCEQVAQAGTAHWIGAQQSCAVRKIVSFVVAMPTFWTEPVKEEAVFRAAGVTQAHAGNSYEIFRTLAATTEVKKGCVCKM